MPPGPIRLAGACPPLQDEAAEDAAQDHKRETLLFEIDPKDAPGLARFKRAELFDFLDFSGVIFVKVEFFRFVVIGEIVNFLGLNGPFQFIAQVGDELGKGFYGAKAIWISAHIALSSFFLLRQAFDRGSICLFCQALSRHAYGLMQFFLQ